MISEVIKSTYGNKVRVRVCGFLVQKNKILLLNHIGLNPENQFWSPPGGGIEFGETIEQCLIREFQEEVNLKIEVKDFLFINEHIDNNLHAIELFYKVKSEGKPTLGYDPEVVNSLSEMKWMTQYEVNVIPKTTKHTILNKNPSLIHDIIKKES